MALSVSAEELRHLYWDEGETLVDLGKRYQRSPGTVHGWFQFRGIPTRSVKESRTRLDCAVTPEEEHQMVEFYQTGLSSNDVAEKLGRDGRLVRMHLQKAGVLRGRAEAVQLALQSGKIRKITVNEHFFDVWTPASAWVLGLVFGDGHVHHDPTAYNYQTTLAGTEQVCRAVALVLGHASGPKPHSSANCWLLRWSSKYMVTSLGERFELCGSKARRLKFPEVPEEAMPHFVRGLWDSDGGWRVKGGYVSAYYVSASEGFVQALQLLLQEKARPSSSRLDVLRTVLNGKNFVSYRLSLSADGSRRLIKWLYHDSTAALRCARKYERVVAFA